MNDNDHISNKAAQEFFRSVSKNDRAEAQRSFASQKVIDEKNTILIPIRQLLKRLTDVGVNVTHHSAHDHGIAARQYAPQELQVWEDKSSPHWLPGHSIYFDHPALVEIAVTNINQRDEGLIVISCSSEHPEKYLLNGPFHSAEQACMALARFLSVCTLRIDRPETFED